MLLATVMLALSRFCKRLVVLVRLSLASALVT